LLPAKNTRTTANDLQCVFAFLGECRPDDEQETAMSRERLCVISDFTTIGYRQIASILKD